MKTLIIGAALLAASLPALAQSNVSISVGQPGFYGRIDLGDAPRPALVYERPVVIQQSPVYYNAAPLYLRVPPGHRQHWGRFCGRYDACGRPVYFVTDEWYARSYVPHYRERYYGHGGGYREHEWREERHERREEYGRDHGEWR